MKWLVRLLYLIIFIVSMTLIVTGQRNVGPTDLFVMLIGLGGILLLLYLYNKKFQ